MIETLPILERIPRNTRQWMQGVLIAAVRNKAGELVGYAKVTRDLTERREAQER